MTGPEPTPTVPIAIVGMSCRLPGADGIDEFWQLLLSGRDAITGPPVDRAATGAGGYLSDIDWFDNEWFGISAREAAVMDPQQRLALEVAVEAIDDAGIGYHTKGSDGAVVFGACGYDHGSVVLGRGGHDAPFAVTGSALSIIANRLSYVLDLHGPSLVLDSACSSSLAALDLAVRLLSDGSVPFAVVGGVNLALLPHTSDYLAEGGFLTPDGRSRPFDAGADGYARGDGCAVVVLQRSTDARDAGNRIYAEILGTAVGSDGRSNGLVAPNGRAQRDVVGKAWSRAGIAAAAAGYLECHGTGTALGDAVEVGALAAVLGTEHAPTWIGSVKSSIGHLEAAAGVTSVIKTALTIHNGVIAPTVGFQTENPMLRMAEHGLRVPNCPIDWSGTAADARLAGVSSFGFGGTNAHAVLRGVAAHSTGTADELPVLIPVTARDMNELANRARDGAQLLDRTSEPPQHHNDHAGPSPTPTVRSQSVTEFAAGTARLLPEAARAAVVAHDETEAADRLRCLAERAAGFSGTGVVGPRTDSNRGGIVFVFSGQGGQHSRMGRVLAARYPVFAAALTAGADAVRDVGGPQVWTPRSGFVLQASDRPATEVVQPALFVFQLAAARLLLDWGVRPDAVVGHSLGEVAAAVVSGALSLRDGARVIVSRSKALARLTGNGAMAVLEATPYEVNRLVEPLRDTVGIAAVNGPRSVVISGDPHYIDTVLRRAKRRGIFGRSIAVDFAAHSPQVGAVLPELTTALEGIGPQTPHTKIFSTTKHGAQMDTAAMDIDYWAENASATVELAAALDAAAGSDATTALEIGPHPALLGALRDHPEFTGSAHPFTTRDDEGTDFLGCLAELYTEGRALNWATNGSFVGAPRRRWQRSHFPLATAGSAFYSDDITDHVVCGETTVPAAYWLRRLLHLARDSGSCALTDFVVHEPTSPSVLERVHYRREPVAARLRAEATGAATLASARLSGDPTPTDIIAWMRVVDANRAAQRGMSAVTPDDLYSRLRSRRLEYGRQFRPLRYIAAGRDRAFADLDGAALHSTATVDGCLHLLAAIIPDGVPLDLVPLPIGIASAWLSGEPDRRIQEVHAFVRRRNANTMVGDIVATDQNGAPVLAFTGVRIRFASVPELLGSRDAILAPADDNQPQSGSTAALSADRPAVLSKSDTTTPRVPLLREIWEKRRPETAAARTGEVANTEAGPEVESDEYAGADRARHTVRRALIIGESEPATQLTGDLDPTVPTERVARAPEHAGPIVSSVLAGRTDAARTAVVVVLAGRRPNPEEPTTATVAGMLDLLQRIETCSAAATLTVVVPTGTRATADQPPVDGTASPRPGRPKHTEPSQPPPSPSSTDTLAHATRRQHANDDDFASGSPICTDPIVGAVAGLVRSMQLESGRPIRLVWADDQAVPADSRLLCRLITGTITLPNGRYADEVLLDAGTLATRRFVPASAGQRIDIDPTGTYVVTGGLGALGSVAVRWLLDAGAHDVVVPTRSPRPVPQLLDGLEDRIVIVRCDASDQNDLDNALRDIRESGCTIRGVVHAAGTVHNATFEAATAAHLAALFTPKLTAATNLIELTATDHLDFTMLFSSATGAFGAPGQAAYAAANAAMDALAREHHPRRVLSVGWGVWENGLAAATGGAVHFTRAGIVPLDHRHGAQLMRDALGQDGHLLAMAHRPSTDTSALAFRLRELLRYRHEPHEAPPVPEQLDHAVNPTATAPTAEPFTYPAPLLATVRYALAAAVSVPPESVDTTADFNDLGLSSLLAIDMRRTLEYRLNMRISTSELFHNPTVETLTAALSARLQPEPAENNR